jgi:alpha-mannosidase
MVLADHWTYSDIGLSWGLKSLAQSITNCLEMADYTPSVKTCINLDALGYAMVAESYPDVFERLKRYLKEGKVEIIGGTYSQPMGSMLSGESNLRQLAVGQQTIQESLGILVSSFLEEEEFTHPQLPQLLKGAGYRYASLAQCDTCGKAGNPSMNLNVFEWRGLDGTSILATPNNRLRFHPPMVTHDIDWLWSEAGRKAVGELQRSGMPLAIKWVEFGWGHDELEGRTANKFYATKFRQLSQEFRVQYTTLTEYLERYGSRAKERIFLRMDDFHKLEPWGTGGDQLRREWRETEAVLAAAERFAAVAHLLDLRVRGEADLDEAWKHLLFAQNHGIALCEDWVDVTDRASKGEWLSDPAAKAFIAATGTPEENRKVNTWGTFGFRLLKVGKKMAHETLDAALGSVSAAVDTASASQGEMAVIVFNPCMAPCDAIAATGRFQFKDGAGGGIVVHDAQGQRVPSQLLALERGESGAIVAANVAFQAHQLPAIGYATYYLARTNSDEAAQDTDLKTSESGFRMENEYVSVEIDGTMGAITKLLDRRQGNDLIDGKRCAFPVFRGRPNREHPAAQGVPDEFDSRQSKAEISWVERGPIRAVVKAVHTWPKLRFEHWVSLQKGQPYVDSRVRVLADVPPPPGEGKINGWQFPLEIVEGYWLLFAPAFKPEAVIRDFPFGVEAATKDAIDSLTFIDLVEPKGGLLIVHGGTQYFKRTMDGVFSNLLIREWNSHFNPKQYGWPRVAEYRYRLVPHANEFTNADRLRSVEAFDQRPICVVEPLHSGPLAKRRSFASVDARGILISSLRGVGSGAYEVRVIEQDGAPASAQLRLDLPLKRYAPCDFLGRTSGEYRPLDKGGVSVSLGAWQVRTFRLER